MRRLSAILLLLAANQLFAQSQYADIEYISVDTTSTRRVVIHWNVTPVTDSQSYKIYRWDSQWNEIGSVDEFSSVNRSFTDATSHPFDHSERYTISTTIPEPYGNDSPLNDKWHQTVFLQSGDYDKCRNSLTLNWSAYVGTSVANYTVYGRKIGQPYIEFGSTADTTFATGKLEEGTDYNFMVVANLQNGQKSLSNIISYTTFEYILPDESFVSIDTVLNYQGKVELRVQIDTATNIDGYVIKGWNSDSIEYTLVPDYTSNRFVFEFDDAEDIYGIYISSCDDHIRWGIGEDAKPLVIEADANSETVLLNWNYSLLKNFFETEDDERFTLFCTVDDGTESIIATELTDTVIELNFNNLADDRTQNFYFRVESTDNNNRFSQSNTVCVERKADLWLPTAFTPNGDGLNDTFGPVVKSAQIIDFEFIVFDRYGGRVFVSTSPDNRWDGTHGGKQVAEGGYLYYLKAKLQNGQTIERKGSVNVVYP